MNDYAGLGAVYDPGYDAVREHLVCPDCQALLDHALRTLERFERVPDRPPHERALAWLDAVCGGRDAVLGLTTQPLTEPEMPTGTGGDQARVVATADLLDAVAARLFDEEAGAAFLAALSLMWREDPVAVRRLRTPAMLAAGLVWAVGEANELVGEGRVTSRQVKDALAVGRYPASYAEPVRTALRGMWRWDHDDWDVSGWRYDPWRPQPAPSPLSALGHAGLLVSATRGRLIRVRDRALAAQAVAA